mgnify:FL=1
MNEVLLKATYSLKAAITSDPRFLALKEKEKAALESSEVRERRKTMEGVARKYEEALSCYPKDSLEVKTLEKQLFEAKKAFDSHPLVKEYTAAFSVTKFLSLQMDDSLFAPFQKKVLTIGD